MSEQFSQEYIAYILKAEGLQEHMPIDLSGAWVAIIDDSDIAEIHNLGDRKHGGLNDLLGDNDSGLRWWWLPTLFQLIRVIEGAGFRWYRRTNETWGIHREGDADRWEVNAYGDDLLAAAQLAVRAVEGDDGL